MNSLIAVSLWIALVTVVPGLITIATVYGAFAVVGPADASALPAAGNDFLLGAGAVAIMVLTQAIGILLEGILVRREWLGAAVVTLRDDLLDPEEFPREPIYPYREYDRLYLLLVRMRDGADPYGHLERAVAQFFLTNNTLVSFGAGIAATVGLVGVSIATQGADLDVLVRAVLYLVGLTAALAVSYHVAVARFRVMTLSTWSLRTERSRD
jgi:hypothetical protein